MFTVLYMYVNSFIHSSIVPLQVPYILRCVPTQHGYCVGVSRRSTQAPASERLAQGPYVVARRIRTRYPSDKRRRIHTNEPPRPTIHMFVFVYTNWLV